MTDEENKKIIDKIDFEEKWLINVKMEDGFISIADIQIAMEGIRSFIEELKGDKCDNNHDCEHCDWVECPLDKENKE